MHILLVNDDGIEAKGLRAFYHAALARGHRLTVCAPQTQQSAMSQRLTLVEPLFVKPCAALGENAYAISGSPADCARLGARYLLKEPADICVSGINDGYNAGFDTYYSGTVGAAREAAMRGIKSVALSINHKADDEALHRFAKMSVLWAERYAQQDAPDNAILSINAPCAFSEKLEDARSAPLSKTRYFNKYVKAESPRMGTLYWMDTEFEQEKPDENSDVGLLLRGYVTYTLLGLPQELTMPCGDGFMREPAEEE